MKQKTIKWKFTHLVTKSLSWEGKYSHKFKKPEETVHWFTFLQKEKQRKFKGYVIFYTQDMLNNLLVGKEKWKPAEEMIIAVYEVLQVSSLRPESVPQLQGQTV